MFMKWGAFSKGKLIGQDAYSTRFSSKTKMKHSAGFNTLPKSSFHAKSLYWRALNVLTAIWSIGTEGHLTTVRHLSVLCPVLWHLTKEKHIVMIHRVWLHLSSFCTHVILKLGNTAKTVSAFWRFNSYLYSDYVVALKCLERVIFVVEFFFSSIILTKHSL